MNDSQIKQSPFIKFLFLGVFCLIFLSCKEKKIAESVITNDVSRGDQPPTDFEMKVLLSCVDYRDVLEDLWYAVCVAWGENEIEVETDWGLVGLSRVEKDGNGQIFMVGGAVNGFLGVKENHEKNQLNGVFVPSRPVFGKEIGVEFTFLGKNNIQPRD